MFGGEYDSASLFSGGGFMPSQATQTTDSGFSPAKNRENQALLPLTVKQISEAHQTSDEKSSFVIDGVDVNNITLVGMVTGKLEKVTDVSFHLDDGTGRIEVHRWVDDAMESNAMAELQNGTYVCVHGHLKVFQGKKQVSAYSCRVVTDFNQIAYHFLECIYVHKCNKMVKVGSSAPSTVTTEINTPNRNGPAVYQSAASNQFSSHPGVSSGTDLQQKVMAVFDEPRSLVARIGVILGHTLYTFVLPTVEAFWPTT
ncbi:replication protein A 32 kDa subunit B-like isoform X2 [Aristolochia californica]|uniref:replication protein A 32 kDa subunit B-like isoform X2 n=1 Tax=Aristolochia californica TaxID=171875 RepID=UPI0035DAB566